MRLFITLAFLLALCANQVRAEEADDLRAQGIAALKESQTNSRAIVDAARHFVKAAELYAAAGNEEKNVEMNSFLYWCKKKMTLQDIDAFTKGGEAAVSNKLAAVEKLTPKADEAQQWLDRAEQFAKSNPAEHLLIAIRFFEVADRLKGSETGLRAMDRSLQEMTQAQPAATAAPTVKPPLETPTPGKKAPIPTVAKQKEAEKTIKDLYKEDFAKTAPADKVALAEKLQKQAEDTADDAASRYGLLTQACSLAAQTGSLKLLLGLFDKLTAAFDGDLKEMKRAHLSVVILKLSDARQAKVASAVKVLLDKPDDAPANVTLGRYRCGDGDFEHGLPLLSKSSNAALVALVKRELQPPTETAEQVSLGDAWWDLGGKSSDKDDKAFFNLMARRWYVSALPNVSGLSRAKLEKRVNEIPTTERHGQTIDLLKLIDPKRDAVAGHWEFNGGSLIGEKAENGRIEIPYSPPEEYDLRIVGKRIDGNNQISCILCKADRQFMWSSDGWAGGASGLEMIGSKSGNDNETTIPGKVLTNNHSYTWLFQIRNSGITLFFDGKTIMKFNKPYELLSLHSNWILRNTSTLGLAHQDKVAFSAVELTEITGTGKKLK